MSVETRRRFSEVIAACHDPEQTLKFLEDKKARMAFAEQYGLRFMATTSAASFINIDYDLSPEPDYKGSLEESGCPEWREWNDAREEELAAMLKFGVYRAVPRSEARGQKLLTSKWVHKRKPYENDEAMVFAAMEKQLDNSPKILDHMVLSGSNIHLLTLADARRLFKSRRRTSMTVTGIGGIRERCAGEGEIEVTVLDESGTHLNLSLGTGYTTNRVPVSLISAAQLLRSGAQIHLERNNSYILLTNNKRISLIEKGGLLYIPALDYDADDEEDEEKQRLKAADQAAAFLGFDPSAHKLTNNNENKNELTNNNENKNELTNNNEDKNELTTNNQPFQTQTDSQQASSPHPRNGTAVLATCYRWARSSTSTRRT